MTASLSDFWFCKGINLITRRLLQDLKLRLKFSRNGSLGLIMLQLELTARLYMKQKSLIEEIDFNVSRHSFSELPMKAVKRKRRCIESIQWKMKFFESVKAVGDYCFEKFGDRYNSDGGYRALTIDPRASPEVLIARRRNGKIDIGLVAHEILHAAKSSVDFLFTLKGEGFNIDEIEKEELVAEAVECITNQVFPKIFSWQMKLFGIGEL